MSRRPRRLGHAPGCGVSPGRAGLTRSALLEVTWAPRRRPRRPGRRGRGGRGGGGRPRGRDPGRADGGARGPGHRGRGRRRRRPLHRARRGPGPPARVQGQGGPDHGHRGGAELRRDRSGAEAPAVVVRRVRHASRSVRSAPPVRSAPLPPSGVAAAALVRAGGRSGAAVLVVPSSLADRVGLGRVGPCRRSSKGAVLGGVPVRVAQERRRGWRDRALRGGRRRPRRPRASPKGPDAASSWRTPCAWRATW